ncbi:MAG TPA: energy transducer TonB, partial [Candidatus Didemnitutus sp.]|nr:energy transducer TonB [Candidatus Didemnitutus sp.]
MNLHGLVGFARAHRLCALWLGWAVIGCAAESRTVALQPGDADLQITQRTAPRFPDRALAEGVGKGQVRALLQVDEAGRLKDLLIVAYTTKEFADATESAIREWRFAPARRSGQPVPAIVEIECRFGIQGVVYVDRKNPGSSADELVGVRFVQQPFTLRDLDQPVKAVTQPAPVYPRSWGEQGLKGRVEVDFYVDADGRIRCP